MLTNKKNKNVKLKDYEQIVKLHVKINNPFFKSLVMNKILRIENCR